MSDATEKGVSDFVVYQNGQPVPVLPCLQRPEVLLRVRPGAVIRVNVPKESWLHMHHEIPVGVANVTVTEVEETIDEFDYFVTADTGHWRVTFLLSYLVEFYEAKIDQPEITERGGFK